MLILTRMFVRWTLLLSGLWLLPVLLIHVQPNNASEIRAALIPPEDCATPCFMGLRPGVTTTEEAVAILNAHPWVEAYSLAKSDGGTYPLLTWAWSDVAPVWFARRGSAFLSLDQNRYPGNRGADVHLLG